MATQLKKTVKPAAGDYTSLDACMDANEQNLVTADKYFDVEIDGDWSGGADTTPVVIQNYTTDATRYINIYTTATARHVGVWDTDYYIVSSTVANAPVVTVLSGYVTITGIQITSLGGGTSTTCVRCSTGGDVLLDKLICYGIAGRSIYNYSNTNLLLTNILSFHGYEGPEHRAGTSNWKNCTTVDNSNYGMQRGTAVNCLSVYNGAADFSNVADTYCASEDSTATGSFSSASINMTALFANRGSDDYHLQSGTTVEVKGAGSDLSGTFTDDIDGETRSAWDIGADEYVTVTSGAVAVAGGYMTTSTKFW